MCRSLQHQIAPHGGAWSAKLGSTDCDTRATAVAHVVNVFLDRVNALNALESEDGHPLLVLSFVFDGAAETLKRRKQTSAASAAQGAN